MVSKNVQLIRIASQLPSDFPIELFKSIAGWDYIQKSPYGHSYYSAVKSWSETVPDSFRIADHWNFWSKGKQHIITTTPVADNSHWTIAQYDTSLDRWVVLKSIKKEDNQFERLQMSLLRLELRINIVLENISKNMDSNTAIYQDAISKAKNLHAMKLGNIKNNFKAIGQERLSLVTQGLETRIEQLC